MYSTITYVGNEENKSAETTDANKALEGGERRTRRGGVGGKEGARKKERERPKGIKPTTVAALCMTNWGQSHF